MKEVVCLKKQGGICQNYFSNFCGISAHLLRSGYFFFVESKNLTTFRSDGLQPQLDDKDVNDSKELLFVKKVEFSLTLQLRKTLD